MALRIHALAYVFNAPYDGTMPHISKKKLNQHVVRNLERYISSIIRDTGTQTRTRIFDELLTQTEKIMIAKRIGVLFLLKKGLSPFTISKTLGVSSSTVNRFAQHTQGYRYKYTIDWVWKNSDEGAFEKFMESLVALVFTGRTKSFKKFIDEL